MASEHQRRVAAIRTFREELDRLAREGILRLDPAAAARVTQHHDTELAGLAREGDVDLTAAAARLSLGMRVATLLGTAALSAAYALFVAAHWGSIPRAGQLALLVLPPLILAGLTHVAATRERSGYVASLVATVAAIALFTNLQTLGTLFNLPDSRWGLLAVGGFAAVLAYGYRLTLPLLIAILALGAWCWSLAALPLGLWWRDAIACMEGAILTGGLMLLVPRLTGGPAGFGAWWRGAGATLMLVGLLLLTASGSLSGLPGLSGHAVEIVYQLLTPVAVVLLVWWGMRRDDRVPLVVGSVGGVLYLYLRLADWFWNVLPKWLFFLLVGAIALAALLVLQRLRRSGVAT